MKCKRTSDGRKHDHGVLQVMRQQAVKAIREGQDVSSVAAAYGINVRSVFRWLADSRVRQLNAQVVDCYEPWFKNVYYKRESCCG